MVDDREANVRQLAESIESGNTGDISDVLHEILADEDGTAEDQRKAKELIDKLAEYKPLAKVEERNRAKDEGEGCCQNRTPDPDSRSIVYHDDLLCRDTGCRFRDEYMAAWASFSDLLLDGIDLRCRGA